MAAVGSRDDEEDEKTIRSQVALETIQCHSEEATKEAPCERICGTCLISKDAEWSTLEGTWPWHCPCGCHAHLSEEALEGRDQFPNSFTIGDPTAAPYTISSSVVQLPLESSSCPPSLNYGPRPPSPPLPPSGDKSLTLKDFVKQMAHLRKTDGANPEAFPDGGDVQQRKNRKNCIVLIVFVLVINVAIVFLRFLGGLPGLTTS